ncbi:MAG: hypothetical protein HC880_04875 [Bacteroidia bacterium]|nr:hypothetical protein [Bacteroidia bacterium]
MKHFLLSLLLTGAFINASAQIPAKKSKVNTSQITGQQYQGYNPDPVTNQNYIRLYQRGTNNLLLGNPCAEKVMRDYHFRYEIIARSHPISGSRYFFHNSGPTPASSLKTAPSGKAACATRLKNVSRGQRTLWSSHSLGMLLFICQNFPRKGKY